MLGQPLAWVNNQFRQYTYDISDIVANGASGGDMNLTIAFESAVTYGQNVSTLPQMEFFPAGILQVVSNTF